MLPDGFYFILCEPKNHSGNSGRSVQRDWGAEDQDDEEEDDDEM